MSGRRTTHLRDLPESEVRKILRVMAESRRGLIAACDKILPTGTTHAKLGALIAAADAYAAHLAGRPGYFNKPAHRTASLRRVAMSGTTMNDPAQCVTDEEGSGHLHQRVCHVDGGHLSRRNSGFSGVRS